MIIGIILSIVLLIFVPVILKWMKVPQYDVYKAKNIFSRAGELTTKLFDLGDFIKESQENSQYRGDFYQDITPSDDAMTQPISDDEFQL